MQQDILGIHEALRRNLQRIPRTSGTPAITVE